MEKPIIDFKKEREFGDTMNATFSFIGQEFKVLGMAMLYFAAPLILISGFVSGYFQYQNLTIALSPEAAKNPFIIYTSFPLLSILVFLFVLLSQTMVITVVYSYIKLYSEKGRGNFSMEQVGQTIRNTYFKNFVGSIVVGLLSIIGMVLCIAPGIYLGVSLSLLWAIMVIENKGVGEAFSRSFDLTKYNWWQTLLLMFVVFLIAGILSSIIQIPMTIVVMSGTILDIKNGNHGAMDSYKVFIVIYTAISMVVRTLLYTIPYVALAFQFYSLLEKKERPSLEEKLKQME